MNRRVHPVAWAAMRFLQHERPEEPEAAEPRGHPAAAPPVLPPALLALALARPALRGAGGAGGIGKGSETAVIALDNSYSMGRTDGGPTRFDQARQAAEQVIDSLQRGSSVAVLLFSDTVRGVIPEPTFDLNLARKIVRRRPDFRPGDGCAAGAATGPRDAAPPCGRAGDLFITDGQANGWKRLDDKVLRDPACTDEHPAHRRRRSRHNLCVSDLQMAGSMASLGEAAQFDVEVTNFGAADAKDVAVRLTPGRRPAERRGRHREHPTRGREAGLPLHEIPRRGVSHGDARNSSPIISRRTTGARSPFARGMTCGCCS